MSAKTIRDKKDFEQHLASGEGKFALFYSGYCPFCLMFLPAFEKRAAGKPGAFVKVSTDSLPELEDAFSIEVVPTVIFFKNGKPEKRLDGTLGRGLTEESLGSFIKSCEVQGKS